MLNTEEMPTAIGKKKPKNENLLSILSEPYEQLIYVTLFILSFW